MPILKDIGRMTNLPGVSPLATSALWKKSIEDIHPMQLQAFVTRLSLGGKRDEAETAVHLCIAEVNAAVERGEIPRPAMVDYTPPNRLLMTAGELARGLRTLGTEKAAAIIFGLENGLSAQQVGRLTWGAAMRMFQAATLTDKSIACTRVCPQLPSLRYVFWSKDRHIGVPAPFLDLDNDVIYAFGWSWEELALAYSRLIMVDEESDFGVVTELLRGLGFTGR